MKHVLWIIAIATGILLIHLDARHRKHNHYERSMNVTVTPGGLVTRDDGQPPAPPLLSDPDSYYWLTQASQLTNDAWRVRWIPDDNAPYGRVVHWSSAYLWYLRGLAQFFQATGMEPHGAWQYTAQWNNPLLLVALALGTAILCRRQLSLGSYCALMAGLLLLPAFKRDFSFACVDYHGLHLLMILGMILALILSGGGYVSSREGGDRPAKLWIIVSGILGAAAAWLQTTLVYPILLAIPGAFAVHALLFVGKGDECVPYRKETYRLQPDLWRLWGITGAVSSLFFYLLEYAPNLSSMRLEVINPLFAVSWLAGAEAARQIALAEQRGSWKSGPNGWIALICLIVCASYPIVILCGPSEWFTLKDPFLLRIHDTIDEFRPLLEVLARTGWMGVALIFGVLPLLGLPALFMVFSVRFAKPDKLLLLLAGAPVLVAGRMAFAYSRFSGLWIVALVCLLFSILIVLERRTEQRGWHRAREVFCVLLILSCMPSYLIAQHLAATQRDNLQLVPGLVTYLYYRDLALDLDRNLDSNDRLFLTDAGITPFLQYYTSRKGTGGLYWENRDGLRATAWVLADYGEMEARQILIERGLNYLLYDASLDNLARLHYARYGKANRDGIQRMFGYRIAQDLNMPDWLEPVGPERVPLLAAGPYRLFRIRQEAVWP